MRRTVETGVAGIGRVELLPPVWEVPPVLRVVHRHGSREPRAGPLEQLGPGVRIELLRGELRDEVLVTERGGMAVGLDVVLVLRRSFAVHVVGIPGAVRTG